MRWLVALCLLTGCDRVFGLQHFGAPDADVVDVADDTIHCYGQYASGALLSVCLPTTPPPTRTFPGAMIDTGGVATDCDDVPGNPGLCVIAAKDLTIDTLIRGRGSRPLILIATHQILIDTTGGIDVSSRRAFGVGAGANDPSCSNPGDGLLMSTSTGGGAGGSFGIMGGKGGDAGNLAAGGMPGGAVTLLGPVRGGCKGGNGLATETNGGSGGGAVYLIAGSSIEVRGILDASGHGGGGSVQIHHGGGGGGSGGLIAMDSPIIHIVGGARIVANGGGGGGGGDTTTGLGGDGLEATLSTYPFSAGGGAGGGNTGGDGGKGGDASTMPGKGTNGITATNGGGGGGGGGFGFIRAYAPSPMIDGGAQISPAAPLP